MFEEDSVLGDEEQPNRKKILVELESLVCKTRQMVGTMMKTGGKVLLTALLGLTGNISVQEKAAEVSSEGDSSSPLLRYRPALSLLPPLPPLFPVAVYVVGLVWSRPGHPLQVCVRVVAALLLFPLLALLLLPAALAAGGVACQRHLRQVTHLWCCSARQAAPASSLFSGRA